MDKKQIVGVRHPVCKIELLEGSTGLSSPVTDEYDVTRDATGKEISRVRPKEQHYKPKRQYRGPQGTKSHKNRQQHPKAQR